MTLPRTVDEGNTGQMSHVVQRNHLLFYFILFFCSFSWHSDHCTRTRSRWWSQSTVIRIICVRIQDARLLLPPVLKTCSGDVDVMCLTVLESVLVLRSVCFASKSGHVEFPKLFHFSWEISRDAHIQITFICSVAENGSVDKPVDRFVMLSIQARAVSVAFFASCWHCEQDTFAYEWFPSTYFNLWMACSAVVGLYY